MRTTVTLAADVAAAADQLRKERGTGISDAVNELVRRGLAQPERVRSFSQTSSAMGEPTLPMDDVGGLLEALEGDDHRA